MVIPTFTTSDYTTATCDMTADAIFAAIKAGQCACARLMLGGSPTPPPKSANVLTPYAQLYLSSYQEDELFVFEVLDVSTDTWGVRGVSCLDGHSFQIMTVVYPNEQ